MKRVNAKIFNKRLRVSLLIGLFVSIIGLTQLLCLRPLFATTVYMYAGQEHFRGVEFTIEVIVDQVTDLYGTAYDVIYDTEFLEVVDSDATTDGIQPKVVEGTLLNSAGENTTFLRSAIDDKTPGSLVLGITRSDYVAGVDTESDTAILFVRFMPKKVGSTSIMFSRQALKDSDNTDIIVGSWDGVMIDIQNLPPGDFDHSGIVDLRDLILALQVLTKFVPDDTYADGDVNGDGKIGIEDVIYVLQSVAELR